MGTGGFEEKRALGEHSDLAAQVLKQLFKDLHVSAFVPGLPRHVHFKFPGSIGEVPKRTRGAFKSLEFSDKNTVHAQ